MTVQCEPQPKTTGIPPARTGRYRRELEPRTRRRPPGALANPAALIVHIQRPRLAVGGVWHFSPEALVGILSERDSVIRQPVGARTGYGR